MRSRNQLIAGAAAAAMFSALAADRGLDYGRKEEADEDAVALLKEVKGLRKQLTERDAEIKSAVEKAIEEAKAAGTLSNETKSALADLAEKAKAVGDRLLEVEQKANRTQGGGQAVKSLGEQFVTNEEVVEHLKAGQGFKGTARMAVKAITSLTTDADGSVGDAIRPDRLAGIVTPPGRMMTIRQLIAPGRTNSNAIEFVQETGFTNAAAPVAETAQKPESTLKFNLKTTNVRTIAHWVIASKQVLDDIPQLQSYIDTRLRYGLAIVEETQLLLGDGTGQNLLGLIPQATDFDDARRVVGDTKLDTIRRAITQVRLSQYRSTGIVMHPNDWEEIELTKTDDGAYIFANPQNRAEQRLWGLPVVDSDAMPEGEFMVGAFAQGAQVFDREQANVEVSTEDRDNFIKNMVTIRAEERLALVVSRPEAFVHGEFEAPAP